jgi:antitoxin component of RelBE/YafQ-DinJ toxin-antitoxin module
MPSSRTIVSYRPTPDEEGILDALAKKLGLSKSRTLAFALKRIAEDERLQPAVALTDEEKKTIEALYAELSPDYWRRRRSLEARQRNEKISEVEREELLALIDQGEDWNVRRLEYLFMLAQRYGKPHDHFLDVLGLRHHPLAEKAA